MKLLTAQLFVVLSDPASMRNVLDHRKANTISINQSVNLFAALHPLYSFTRYMFIPRKL